MINFFIIFAIICFIGFLIIVYDLIKYRNYNMWEDETGFHMEKNDAKK